MQVDVLALTVSGKENLHGTEDREMKHFGRIGNNIGRFQECEDGEPPEKAARPAGTNGNISGARTFLPPRNMDFGAGR